MNAAFWQDKRVFITGHTGFKGAWLSLWLQSLGAKVTGYALPAPTQPNLFDIAEIEQGMSSIVGDVRDGDALIAAMTEQRPDIVIHMAAQSLVRRSYADPVETYATNVLGTVNLLEAVRQVDSVRAVVNVTSDKCYENQEWAWGYRENDRLGGYDPYSNSKACAELVTYAYRRSFFSTQGRTALASVRAGNVIGGGDWAEDRLIPDLINGFSTNKPVLIRNPNAIRPWQHVLEPLSGYLTVAERLYLHGVEYAEDWNFGPHDSDAKPVYWIADKLAALWGDAAAWQLDGEQHPHEAHYLKLDCSKAHARLGWQPRWTLEQAITAVVAWYKAYRQGTDIRTMCLGQIDAYVR